MAWQSLSENTKCAICRGMALAAICLTKFGKALKLYGYDTKILRVARDCVLELQVISIRSSSTGETSTMNEFFHL